MASIPQSDAVRVAPAAGRMPAWLASKTQLYFPEPLLNAALGAVTGTVGALYAINFFFPLPFRI